MNKKKKIFILQNSQVSFGLDAAVIFNPEQYDLYLIVNNFGHDIVLKKNQQHFYSQIHVTQNFDAAFLIRLILSESNEYLFDVVTNSEETMPICGKIRKEFGLDEEDYARFYDKHVMKQRLLSKQFEYVPRYSVFDSARFLCEKETYLKELLSDLEFPLFAKPVQCYSSINLCKLHNFDELQRWAQTVPVGELFEIDEFIDGTMYHCDSYIQNGKIVLTLVSMNSRPCYNFTQGEMKGTIVLPADHPDTMLLQDFTRNVLQALGMPKAGVTHLEVIKKADQRIYFIEIAHRSPGCLIPKMYQHHAMIDTIASHFLLQINPEYNFKPKLNHYAAWACYPKKPGKVMAFKSLPENLNSHCEVEWFVSLHEDISHYSRHGRDYTGTLFMTNPDFDTLYKEFIELNDENLCVIQ
ncbi:MAG: hypothetical protein A3F17_01135 [Gammaproteobacteria bacterium RIFCSPHIGHO2_12_FULL_41_15]|nr:MAG: hypothetical protein A3F17_01135 [Gammaproteobacteria bacterium RIFCSPHIGHO2_12_FULL_41_15]